MVRRRIPDPLLGLILAIILMALVLILAERLNWFGDDPTLTGAALTFGSGQAV